MTGTYSVLVGNIGWCVQDELDYEEVVKAYNEYVAISQGSQGIGHRGYNEQVSLWASDEDDPIAEYEPSPIEFYDPEKPSIEPLTGKTVQQVVRCVVCALQSYRRQELVSEFLERVIVGDGMPERYIPYDEILQLVPLYCTVDENIEEDE